MKAFLLGLLLFMPAACQRDCPNCSKCDDAAVLSEQAVDQLMACHRERDALRKRLDDVVANCHPYPAGEEPE